MAPRKRGRKSPTSKPKPVEPSHHFVGRPGSPVLEKYPPKAEDEPVRLTVKPLAKAVTAPPSAERPATSPAGPGAFPTPAGTPPSSHAPVAPAKPLISLERPFDIDEFSQLLGQTQIQVTVPRDSLAEVLRRVCEFMGFGIYVYTVRVRPGPEELLKTFVVELQRVDYSPQAGDWAPFQDRGRADNPFGPTGTR